MRPRSFSYHFAEFREFAFRLHERPNFVTSGAFLERKGRSLEIPRGRFHRPHRIDLKVKKNTTFFVVFQNSIVFFTKLQNFQNRRSRAGARPFLGSAILQLFAF